MNFKNLNIGTRLTLGFGLVLVLVLLCVFSAVGIWRLQQMGDAADAMAKRTLLKERIAAEWRVATSRNSIRIFALVKTLDAADKQYFQKGIIQASLEITENSKKLYDLLETAEEKSLFADSAAKRAV